MGWGEGGLGLAFCLLGVEILKWNVKFLKGSCFVFVCSWDFDSVLLITCSFVLTFFGGVTDRVLI